VKSSLYDWCLEVFGKERRFPLSKSTIIITKKARFLFYGNIVVKSSLYDWRLEVFGKEHRFPLSKSTIKIFQVEVVTKKILG
jgi:hypothetical protein